MSKPVNSHLALSLAPLASSSLAMAVCLSMEARSTGVKSSSLRLYHGRGGKETITSSVP